MKYPATIFLSIFYFFSVRSQTVLLEREEDGIMDSTFSSMFDEEKNSSWITNSVYGIGFPVTQSVAGGEIENEHSIQLALGSVNMYQIADFFALGIGVTYNFYNYRLEQSPEKILPNAYAENNKETIRLNCLQFGPAMRINFTPRKYSKAVMLDLGADVVWVMGSNHKTWNENADGSEIKISTRKLPYTEKFQYMGYARFGIGAIALYGSYRLTDVFKEAYNYPELPALNIGVAFIL
ncbi:MAG: outer membrane beta-barrel protein [Chitinophagales bacterium]|nr:outer membrane beta-barrel protein [Chitinophagales bacterium]